MGNVVDGRRVAAMRYRAAPGEQSLLELPSAHTFDSKEWQCLPSSCTEERQSTLNSVRFWSLRFDGPTVNGQLEAFHDPGLFGLLISRLSLQGDHLVRMRFEEDMVQISFMLRRDLYSIESLGMQDVRGSSPAGPCCMLLHFKRGEEILWRSRASLGATKIDLFVPSRAFEKLYGVDAADFPPALNSLMNAAPQRVLPSLPIRPDIMDCLQQMVNSHRESPIRGAFVRGKFHNLMTAIWFASEGAQTKLTAPPRAHARDQEFLERAVAYVTRNIGAKLTIDTIARAAGTNRNRLNGLFRTNLGETVFEHVQRVRLERARILLMADVGRYVTEIAQEIGYADSTTFARAFQGRFGSLPSDLRKLRS